MRVSVKLKLSYVAEMTGPHAAYLTEATKIHRRMPLEETDAREKARRYA